MTNLIAVYYDNITFKSRIEYVFDYIFSHFFIRDMNIKVEYNPIKPSSSYLKVFNYKKMALNDGSININPQELFFSDKKVEIKSLFANEFYYNDIKVYSIEEDYKPKQIFLGSFNINFDLIEMIFFHISRYEEYFSEVWQLDKHQRMKSDQQFLVQKGLHRNPVVDHAVYSLLDGLGFSNLNIKTTYSVTHDIDAIRKFPSFYKFIRALARTIKKGKRFHKIPKLIKQYLKVIYTRKDPYDTFKWLLSNNSSDEKIIYFMSGGKTQYDNFYSIQDSKLEYIFNFTKKNGYMIGLHPSYATNQDRNQFSKEIDTIEATIEKKISHTRQHILHFSFADSLEILESFKIKFDSTLGYQDLIGFRCGTGHNYYLYNFNKEKPSLVHEKPLVVMDGPLLIETNYNIDNSNLLLMDFLNTNINYTKITFNFHNSSFDEAILDSNKFRYLYIALNKFINDKQ